MFFWLLIVLVIAGCFIQLWSNRKFLTTKKAFKIIGFYLLIFLVGSFLIFAYYDNLLGLQKPSWFDTARFGVFVHWGHVSQQGWELSWPMIGGLPNLPSCQKIPKAEYNRKALNFNPVKYDPKDLAKRIKNMGAQYVVITTKHHDGFSMYPTKLSDWSIARTKYGRDLIGPFVGAVRAEGLHPGLYFSLCDWHYPDYPTFNWQPGDKNYDVYRNWRWAPRAKWKRYLNFMFGQLRELLTNYGRIDVLWFDGGWEVAPWRWRPYKLKNMIKSLQPQIMINDRLLFTGGYKTPEQFIPQKPLPGPWETCLTMNESWGYDKDDYDYKPVQMLIQTICEVAAKGGNLLLNISPRGDGTLPPEQIARMEAIGRWMKTYGESIIGTKPGLEPWQFYGPSTKKGNTYYLHLVMRPAGEVTVRGLKVDRIKSVRALKTGAGLKWSKRIAVADIILKNRDPLGEITIKIPPESLDPDVSVMAIDFEK